MREHDTFSNKQQAFQQPSKDRRLKAKQLNKKKMGIGWTHKFHMFESYNSELENCHEKQADFKGPRKDTAPVKKIPLLLFIKGNAKWGSQTVYSFGCIHEADFFKNLMWELEFGAVKSNLFQEIPNFEGGKTLDLTPSLSHHKEMSVDAALLAVLSELDGIFTFKDNKTK